MSRDQVHGEWPEFMALVDDSETDVLAYMVIPMWNQAGMTTFNWRRRGLERSRG